MTRQHIRGSDSPRYLDWIGHAQDDLEAARILKEYPECINCAAFHCQQSIEKALKGYILFRDHRHVDGHNLTWLCKQAINLNPEFDEWMDESFALNRYYIETRYPADIPPVITCETINRTFTMADRMINFILQEINVDKG